MERASTLNMEQRIIPYEQIVKQETFNNDSNTVTRQTNKQTNNNSNKNNI